MEGWGYEIYGERIAPQYDEMIRGRGALAPGSIDDTVAFLAGLVPGGGRALELAIGTGRIALPLASAGIEVHGVDISPAMVAELRAKPGGGDIPVTMGDMADVPLDGSFDLVYLVFNTFFVLSGRDQQRCFENVAAHLTPGGSFVVETFVPDLDRFVDDQTVRVRSIEVDEVVLECSRHMPDEQQVFSQLVTLSEAGTKLYPIALRYAWPAQLDDMARAAGLRRRDRWSSWTREPFTDDSEFHVSVYEKVAGQPVGGPPG
jgi:SAM-dependent methyltransferase